MSQLFEALKKIQRKDREPGEAAPITPPRPPKEKRVSLSKKGLVLSLLFILIVVAIGWGSLYYISHLVPEKNLPSVILKVKPHRVASSIQYPTTPSKPPGTPDKKMESAPPQSQPSHPPPPPSKPPTKTGVKPPAKSPTPPKLSAAAHEKAPVSATPSHTPSIEKPFSLASPKMAEEYKSTYLLMSANEALAKGDLLNALNLYNQYVSKVPGNARVWNNIGAIYLQMADPSRALTVLEKARKLNPEDPEIRVNLAIAQWEKGLCNSAHREVESLYLRDDLSPKVVYNLTVLMIRMGSITKAHNLLTKAEKRLGKSSLLVSLHPYFRGLEEKRGCAPCAGPP